MNEDLLKAAEYMSEHGWCQGDLEDADGRVCVAGAIKAVVRGKDRNLRSTSAVISLHEYLVKEYGDNCAAISIPAWNDDPDRTVEEVILALKQAGSA